MALKGLSRVALMIACGIGAPCTMLATADPHVQDIAIAPLAPASTENTSTAPPMLLSLIEAQQTLPDASAQRMGPPPGLDVQLLRSDAPDARSAVSLAQALEACRPSLESNLPAPGEATPPAQVGQAAQLGASARTLRGEGQLSRALEAARDAARLDAANPAHWRVLGDVCMAQGNRPAALVAWQRALELGERDLDMLLQLGWIAGAFEEHEQAATALSLAHPDHAALDPARRHVHAATLGRALLALGYVTAARELIVQGLDLPEHVSASAPWDEAIGLLARNRPRRWTELGDALLQVGALAQAEEAFSNAGRAPGADHDQLLRRRVFLDMAQGASGRAAWRVLHALNTADASTAVDLVQYVAQNPTAGPLLRQAIEQSSAAGGGNRITLTRARAAAATDPAHRTDVLRDHIVQFGPDWAIVDDLRAAFATLAPDAAFDAAAQLVRAAPHVEPWVSGALPALDSGDVASTSDDVARILAARNIEGLPAPAGETERGPKGALRLLERPCSAPFEATRLRALVRVGTAMAQGAHVDALLDAYNPASASDRLILAEALAERGRARDALRAIEPLLNDASVGPPIGARAQSLAAEQHARLEQWAAALQGASRALAIDPLHEPAHAVRLDVLGGRHEAADAVAFSQAMSELRRDLKESSLLSWMRASQARLNGQASIAQDALLRLVDRAGVGPQARQSLASLWLDAQDYELATKHILAWIERHPTDAHGTAMLARTLAADRRNEAARITLSQALRARPGELLLLATFEELIHNKLIDPRHAGESERGLQSRRLANSPPTMATFFERAQVATQAGNLVECQTWMHRALQLVEGEPTPSLVRDLSNLMAEIVSIALQRSDAAGQDAAITAFDEALAVAPRVTRTTYDLRMSLLQTRIVDPHRYVQAIMDCMRVYPDHQDEYLRRATASLVDAKPWREVEAPDRERARAATTMLREASNVLGPPSATLLGLWLSHAAAIGEHAEVRDAVAAAMDAALLREAMASWAGMYAKSRRPDSEERFTRLARGLATCLLDEEAPRIIRLYEEALRVRPLDPETCNSLGYRLLDEDMDIERAAALIDIAYKSLRDQAHVTDSMGWVAYKTGRIHDDLDPKTGLLRSGAVTLLSDALHILDRDTQQAKAMNPEDADVIDQEFAYTRSEVSNHLGDALWLANDREGALHHWTIALDLAAVAQQALRSGAIDVLAPDRAAVDLERIERSIPAKLAAARTDRQPAIARVHGPVNRPMTREEQQKAAVSQFPTQDQAPKPQ